MIPFVFCVRLNKVIFFIIISGHMAGFFFLLSEAEA